MRKTIQSFLKAKFVSVNVMVLYKALFLAWNAVATRQMSVGLDLG